MASIKTLIPETILKKKCLLHFGMIRVGYWVISSHVGYVSRRGLALVIVKTPVACQIANNAVTHLQPAVTVNMSLSRE